MEIFTPSEMTRLLALAPAKLVPFLVLGGFAGLRTAEMERLDWSKVDVAGGYITVDASIAKTNSRRLVPIAPNLTAWLAGCRKERGPVVELANVVNALTRLVTAMREAEAARGGNTAGFRWKHNALRHSFCSYRLAEVKNAAQVSLEAGNSPQMIFQHYRELVTEKEAGAWFAITPESAAAERAQIEASRIARIVAFPARAVA